MKKIMILFICFTLLFICSCRKTQKDEPVILIDVIESTIKEVYYIDEFNITSIKINVSIDGVSKEEILTPLLIENYPSKITEGSYTFIINYEGVKKEFTLNVRAATENNEQLDYYLSDIAETITKQNANDIRYDIIISDFS